MHSAASSVSLRTLHPAHALLLAFPATLFPGTFAADLAYARTAEIQWSNFAQWLNAAGLVFGGLAGGAALLRWLRQRRETDARRVLIHGGLLAAALGTGLMAAFIHARDAWGIMPDALWWSGISAALALAAAWIAWDGFGERGRW